MIPVLENITEVEIKGTKKIKGKIIPPKKHLTKIGRWYILVVITTFFAGYWKYQRDYNYQTRYSNIQISLRDTVGALNLKIDLFKSIAIKQYKSDSVLIKNHNEHDSLVFAEIKGKLKKKNIEFDKNWSTSNGPNKNNAVVIQAENGGTVSDIHLNNINKFN